jgi:hypothetical protein
MAESAKDNIIKSRLKYFGPGTVIVVLSFVVAFLFMKPAPPRKLVIGTGRHRWGLLPLRGEISGYPGS